MGKYKQWLHHQEIGRRLRDQINTLEQERARVQKMAPAHPTSLPDLENPMIAALLSYTRAGNKLSNIDVIKAAMPKIDPVLEQRRPAPNGAAGASGSAVPAQSVVAGLQARAASIPADPLEQMRDLSRGASAPNRSAPNATQPPSNAGTPSTQPGKPGSKPDSVSGWWQRQRSSED